MYLFFKALFIFKGLLILIFSLSLISLISQVYVATSEVLNEWQWINIAES